MSERSSRRFAQLVDIVLGERRIFVQEPLLWPSITTEMLRSEAPCAMGRTFTAAEPSAWHLRGDAVRTCHTVADLRRDAAVAVDLEALDLPSRSSASKARRTYRWVRSASAAARGKLRMPYTVDNTLNSLTFAPFSQTS